MNSIEDSLKRAINESPYLDVERLLEEPIIKMEEHDYITRQEIPQKTRIRRLSPALALCSVAIIAFVSYFYMFTIPYGHIALDINPSFQLTMNRMSSVITLEALNDDGEEVLEAANIKGSNLKENLTKILDTMVEKGYLSAEDNAILVSIDNKSSKKAESLLLEVEAIIKEYLSSRNITSEIKERIITDNAEEKEKARDHGMSAGKLELIYEILEDNPELGFDYLSKLSLKELIALEEKYDDMDDEDDYEDEEDDDEDDEVDKDGDKDDDEDEDDDIDDQDDDDEEDDHDDSDDDEKDDEDEEDDD